MITIIAKKNNDSIADNDDNGNAMMKTMITTFITKEADKEGYRCGNRGSSHKIPYNTPPLLLSKPSKISVKN